MRTPSALTSLDDRVLARFRGRRKPAEDGDLVDGDRTVERTETVETTRPPRSGDGLPKVLDVVYKVSRLVFLALALAVLLGIVFVLAPTNPDNVIVRNVADLASGAAGPFKDVFTVADNREREQVVNYAFAAFVYLLAATLVRKLPGAKS